MMKLMVMSKIDWLVFVQMRCLAEINQLQVVEDILKSMIKLKIYANDKKLQMAS